MHNPFAGEYKLKTSGETRGKHWVNQYPWYTTNLLVGAS